MASRSLSPTDNLEIVDRLQGELVDLRVRAEETSDREAGRLAALNRNVQVGFEKNGKRSALATPCADIDKQTACRGV